jgi:hypothetical protein
MRAGSSRRSQHKRVIRIIRRLHRPFSSDPGEIGLTDLAERRRRKVVHTGGDSGAGPPVGAVIRRGDFHGLHALDQPWQCGNHAAQIALLVARPGTFDQLRHWRGIDVFG